MYVAKDVGLYDIPTERGFVVAKTDDDVGLFDTPIVGGLVVAKTVKTISSVFCQYFYETCTKNLNKIILRFCNL